MAGDRPEKIAIIGATSYEYGSPEVRVTSFPWDRLDKVTNLADHDTVILSLLSLGDPGRLDAASFRRMLDVRVAQEVLGKRDGIIVVMGAPRFDVEYRSGGAVHSEPFLTWTGIEYSWDDRPGDTVERRYAASGGPFKPFADRLVRWSYSLAECRPHKEEFAKVWPVEDMRKQGQQPAVVVNEICETSYRNALVFSVEHAVEHRASDYHMARLRNTETVPLSNPILFLPENQFSEEEALEFVLRDLGGVAVFAPEPQWVEHFSVPGQERVDREISELEDRIEELKEEHGHKLEERARLRSPLKLLYQSGGALEEAVWSALEDLGAEVERPVERNKEDGWVTVQVGDDTLEGVLEVKSIDKQHFGAGGLRQLFDWISRGVALREKRYTGIFVGNAYFKDPPRARRWPFNINWTKDAELSGFAAIRSEDLYVLYLLDRTGRLDRDEFWRSLFSTNGPFDMRPYREELTDEEKDQLENLPQA